MTLKEEFEILRGESIEVFDGNPMDIPCIETSDPKKLCSHPVVSVSMITYNHEPYIRQAIEGVMMQKTDFEFELVIGEDASQDKTREICFEYQKKYPEKIRVLWWHENVSRSGGNGRRVKAHCRGEFIAFCEGDDYWIDPLKLQKQIEIMRQNPSVVLCFGRSKILEQRTGEISDEISTKSPKGLMSGEEFSKQRLFGFMKDVNAPSIPNSSMRTLTAMIRKPILLMMCNRFQEIFTMSLRLGDTTMWLGGAYFGDIFFMTDVTGVYRMNSSGITRRDPGGLQRDGVLVRIYYAMKTWGVPYRSCLTIYRDMLFNGWIGQSEKMSPDEQINLVNRMATLDLVIEARCLRYRLYMIFLKFGILTKVTKRICDYVFYHFGRHSPSMKDILAGHSELLAWEGTSTVLNASAIT